MGKNLLRGIVILLLVIPGISWLCWWGKPEQSMRVLILDKTTPDKRYSEHLSFNWVLTHNKYTQSSGRFYQASSDYFGFFPIGAGNYYTRDLRRFTSPEIAELADTLDAVFCADNYGIYSTNWREHEFYGTDTVIQVYGGLKEQEYLLFREMMKKGKSILGEFNMFAVPTTDEVRNSTEKLLDIYWSGWSGRYFHSLDAMENAELPCWLPPLYRNQYKTAWNFSGPGIVLVNKERILVLEKGTHLNLEIPFIECDIWGQVKYNLPERVHYPYWFDITLSGDQNEVLAWYQIAVNELGDSLLRSEGIPHKFPALIERDQDYFFLYMAGDFSDNPIGLWSAYFEGIDKISAVFYQSHRLKERNSFFWRFYRPLITSALDRVQERVRNDTIR
jgi:hypothetical protein